MIPTPEQSAVIAHPLEPLRVVAGAGAGKTSTMALRLCHLVSKEPDDPIEPEQALGITFTNKAAEQLSNSLRTLLPELTTAGRSVAVATYHGFARSLLVEFGALVGIERNAVLLGAGYQRELMRRALGGGHYDQLDLSAAARRVEDMSTLWGHLGDNLRTPEQLLTLSGDEVVEARSELASALGRYAKIKRDVGMVDYSDLIAMAHALMDKHQDIADTVRSRYRVVLLDEFQDTNAAQRLLLLSIFGRGFPVTAVGDADQTIYEWRGASIDNFESFPTHFAKADGSPAATLTLSVNHRSDRLILDVANVVKGQIGGGAGVDRLQPGPNASAGFVGCARLNNRRTEAEFIADEIQQLHGDLAWRDVACLFRRNSDIGAIREALERRSIPVEVASLGGLLNVPIVADLHAWLRVLGDPDDAVAALRILIRGRYRLGLGDIGPLASWVRAGKDEEDGVPGRVLLEAIDELDKVAHPREAARERLEHFRSLFRDLLQQAQGVSLVELCLRILDRTDTWQEVEALDDAARLSARLNLYRFLDLAEEWSPLEGRPSLRSFLEYLELLAEETSTDQLDTARLSGEDAVALMTVHRAKGLEWPAVFLPAVVDAVFPARGGTSDDPVDQARSLPYELRVDRDHLPQLPDNKKARLDVLRPIRMRQEWRVAYVAVTRAKSRLYLTGAHWYGGVRPKDPSEFYDLVAGISGVTVLADEERGERPHLDTNDGPAESDHVFGEEGWEVGLRRALADPSWPAQEAERLGLGAAYAAAMDQMGMDLGEATVEAQAPDEPFRTSVTGLVTYATCPKRFFWSEIDRLPRRPSKAAKRGVEVHRQIELHNRGAMALEWERDDPYDVAPDEGSEKVTGAFDAYMASRFAAERPAFVEVPFDLDLKPARIRGRIDAIYADGGDWEIVDFKSGYPREDPARRVQLEAYAVAATDVPFGATGPDSLRVTFAYLGGGLTEVTEAVDDAWLSGARDHLDELTAAAAGEAYETTPSDACRGCDFLRFCDPGKAFVAEAPA